jgi:hypothetical protein
MPRPPLWSSGQSSWLQIQRSRFDSWCYQIFWEVVGLERGPLNLVSTTEELLGRSSSGSGLESRECGRRDPSHRPCDTLSSKVGTKFADNRRSLGIVRTRAQATEVFLIACLLTLLVVTQVLVCYCMLVGQWTTQVGWVSFTVKVICNLLPYSLNY